MPITTAEIKDIPELVLLINSAYRGEASRGGWTTEADIIDGALRTDENNLLEQMEQPGAAILKYTDEKSMITGCAFVQKKDRVLYFGMLSVSPALQDAGIGKKILSAVEAYAQKNNCFSVYMEVISLRKELIEWYEKRGYCKTNEKRPFPAGTKFGTPKRPLEFVIMKKNLL